tara:strand:+ start:644 stop:811 length:168 start_codon:yes stop_codon:yes gene_type:complete
MDKEKLLELLNEIDDILTDAYNTGQDSEENSDSLYYIDDAQSKLEELTIKLNEEK